MVGIGCKEFRLENYFEVFMMGEENRKNKLSNGRVVFWLGEKVFNIKR